MEEKTLFRVALICSISGIIILILFSKFFIPPLCTISGLAQREGELVTVEGQVLILNHRGDHLFLTIRDGDEEEIIVPVFASVKDLVPEFTTGDMLRITGMVEVYRGTLEIVPRSHADVELLWRINITHISSIWWDALGDVVKTQGFLHRTSTYKGLTTLKIANGSFDFAIKTYMSNKSYLELGDLIFVTGVLDSYNRQLELWVEHESQISFARFDPFSVRISEINSSLLGRRISLQGIALGIEDEQGDSIVVSDGSETIRLDIPTEIVAQIPKVRVFDTLNVNATVTTYRGECRLRLQHGSDLEVIR